MAFDSEPVARGEHAAYVPWVRAPARVPVLWVARLLWVAPLGLLISIVLDIVQSSREEPPSMDDMRSIAYVFVLGAALIVSAVVFALSFVAYQVVRGGSAVLRGVVLGVALLIFATCAVVAWGSFVMARAVSGLVIVGPIVMFATGLAGMGAVAWYFFGWPSGRGRRAP